MMKVKLCKVYTLESCKCQQGDENCFRYNKIRDFDTLDRQMMGAYKYASTFPIAACNKNKCDHRKKKTCVKKYENTQLFLQVRN